MEGPKDYSISLLTKLARHEFLNDESKSRLDKCELQMGNFSGQPMEHFTNKNREKCSVWEYLDDFAITKFKMYLLTTIKSDIPSSEDSFEKLTEPQIKPSTNQQGAKQNVQYELKSSNSLIYNSNTCNDVKKSLNLSETSFADTNKKSSSSFALPGSWENFSERYPTLENLQLVKKKETSTSGYEPSIKKGKFDDTDKKTINDILKKISCPKLDTFKDPNVFSLKSPKPTDSKAKKEDVINTMEPQPNSTKNLENIRSPLQSLSCFQKKDLAIIPKDELKTSKIILGSGSFGVVKKGSWNFTPVAIKSMPYLQNNENDMDIKKEVLLLSKVRHENIVSFMGVCIEPNAFIPMIYIVMEYFECDSLWHVLFDAEVSQEHKLDLTDKNYISFQILKGVAYLHSRNILHRDIKSSNILVSNDGKKVKICDLGLSTFSKISGSVSSIMQSKKGSIAGTMIYISPEILVNRAKATKSSDMWAVCCTLIEIYGKRFAWTIKTRDVEQEMKSFYTQRLAPDTSCIPEFVRSEIDKGFSYYPDERPSALNLLKIFNKSCEQLV